MFTMLGAHFICWSFAICKGGVVPEAKDTLILEGRSVMAARTIDAWPKLQRASRTLRPGSE